jgi:hypothetical protein
MNHYIRDPNTYDHRVWKTGLPVRSAVLKPHAGWLVVGWVTTSESQLLYVFGLAHPFSSSFFNPLFASFARIPGTTVNTEGGGCLARSIYLPFHQQCYPMTGTLLALGFVFEQSLELIFCCCDCQVRGGYVWSISRK